MTFPSSFIIDFLVQKINDILVFRKPIYCRVSLISTKDLLLFARRSKGNGDCTIQPGIPWNAALEQKIKASEKELIEERDLVKAYLS